MTAWELRWEALRGKESGVTVLLQWIELLSRNGVSVCVCCDGEAGVTLQIRCTDHSGDLVISVNGRSVNSTRTQHALLKNSFAPPDTLFDLTSLADNTSFQHASCLPYSSLACL